MINVKKAFFWVAFATVVVCNVGLFFSISEAQEPWKLSVYGYATRDGNTLANYPVQAMDSSHAWQDVATSDGSGYYSWQPGQGWYARVDMRVKPLCDSELSNRAEPTGTHYWYFHPQSQGAIQVDVTSTACPP